MTEVTIQHAGPAEGAAAQAADSVTDGKGRVLKLRELTLLDEVDIYSAIGSQDVDNRGVLHTALLVARVASIDGVPLVLPKTGAELRAAIQRVGREGATAVLTTEKASAKPQAEDTTAEVALAKNS